MVDPIRRKGCRFIGMGQVLTDGPDYERIMDCFATERGTDYRARAHDVVLITVTAVEPLISTAYNDGSTEEQIAAKWRAHFRSR